MKEKGIIHAKIIAYHSQANRQIERTNQEIKKYLWKYINQNQENWPDHLLILKYAYNTRKPEKRTYIPYQVVFGKLPAITAKKSQEKTQFRKRIQKETRKPTTEYPVSKYKKDD